MFTYKQQLDKLENEKGLIITDRKYAEKILREISYYSLIGGYKQPFKHSASGKYLRVHLKDVRSLRQLRSKQLNLKIRQLEQKTFKGISATAKGKVPKKQLTAYKKMLKKKGISEKKQKITK